MDFEINSACRVCLESDGVSNIFTSIRTVNASKISCLSMMSALFSMPISRDDNLPQSVCQRCYTKVFSAYKLKNLAEKSHETLLNRFVKRAPICYPEDCKLEFEVEIKEEFLVNLKDEKCDLAKIENWAEPLKVEADREEEGSLEDKVGSVSGIKPDDVSDDGDSDNDVALMVDANFSSTNEGNWEKTNLKEKIVVKRKPGHKKKLKTESNEKKKYGRKKLINNNKEKKGGRMCDLCGKVVMNLQDHRKRHNPELLRVSCSECPRTLVDAAALRKHRLRCHLGQTYYCPICHKEYKNRADHIRNNHSSKPLNFPCLVCGRAFHSGSMLKGHMKGSHTVDNTTPCPTCGKFFRDNSSLNYHRRRVHDGEKTHICQYCSKAFFSAQNLDVHIRFHTKEKNFECNECGKAFPHKSSLKFHLLRHMNIRSAQCPHCDKAFVTTSSLSTHLVTHTKTKKYECRYCGVKFGRLHHRNRHQKTAHENKAMS